MMNIRMSVCMYVYMFVCLYVYMYMSVCPMSVCMCMHMCARAPMSLYIHVRSVGIPRLMARVYIHIYVTGRQH